MTRVIEADDAGCLTLSAEVLGGMKPRARYVVETEGATLIVQPETDDFLLDARPAQKPAYKQWKQEWDVLSEQISEAWQSNESAAEIVAGMRR